MIGLNIKQEVLMWFGAMLFQIVVLAVTVVVSYFLIKMAVKNGIIEAHKKITEQSGKMESI